MIPDTPTQDLVMTQAGFARLRDELATLVDIRREAVAERLRVARTNGGDVLDNGELQDALEEQALLERRIASLQTLLGAASVVPATTDGSAGIGTTVRLRTSSGDILRYELVGAGEADGSPVRISIHSPVGQALVGRRPGDRIEVRAPRRLRHLELVSVEPTRTGMVTARDTHPRRL